MKKTLIILAVVLTVMFSYISIRNKSKPASYDKNTLNIGHHPVSFTLGMKDSQIYELENFYGKYMIVLAFLDDKAASKKLNALMENNKSKLLSSAKDLLWFNLVSDNSEIVIHEMSKIFDLKYKTLKKYMPPAYNFKTLPTFVVIDRTGIIKMIYNGYSPTFIDDIMKSLKEK